VAHFPPTTHLTYYHQQQQNNNTMPQQSKEANITLAIEAIHHDPQLSIQAAARVFEAPKTTLRTRLQGQPPTSETHHTRLKLTSAKEEALVQYIINLDSQEFGPRIDHIRDIANTLLATRHAPPIGKLWPYNFTRRREELKMHFSRTYDFQRALYKDPALINAWFRLVANMRSKYSIQDCNFYNFNETGFIMGVICSNTVVIHANRQGRSKQLQPSNHEWATVIECVSSNGFVLLPFLIVQGVNHLAS